MQTVTRVLARAEWSGFVFGFLWKDRDEFESLAKQEQYNLEL